MAETEETDKLDEPKVETKVFNISKVDCTLGLTRFLHLGSYESNFNEKYDLIFKFNKNQYTLQSTIEFLINKLVESDPLAPLNLVKKAIQSKCLYSNDAAIAIITFCLCETKNEDLKKEIRKSISELILTPEDMLKFMYFFSVVKLGKLNLGRGLRTALKRWYAEKSTDELIEILSMSRKFQKVGHKNLLHIAHVKFKDDEKNKIVQAFRNKSSVELSADASEIDKKIHAYRQLKRAKSTQEVIDALKSKEVNYKFQHVPPFALKSTEVVELILPLMSFREVLDNLLLFCSHKMLKVQEAVSKKICNALQAPHKVITDANLHPIYVFSLMKTLEKRLTVQQDPASVKHENGNAAQENAADDKAKAERKVSNPYVIKKLQNVFAQTLTDQPKTGCRYFITVNFRKFSKRQSKVSGMPNVLCSELQAIIALALLKNEKEVSVMSFTETSSKLKSVEWTAETSYEKAMEIYAKEAQETPKTKEILNLPLKKAMEDKKKVDVFITFVSSLGRTLGDKGKPDFLYTELQNYRRIMNLKMTKYIIINMTRKKPDIHYSDNNVNEKGILEIVGFSDASTKVIEGFAKNAFA